MKAGCSVWWIARDGSRNEISNTQRDRETVDGLQERTLQEARRLGWEGHGGGQWEYFRRDVIKWLRKIVNPPASSQGSEK